MPDVGQPLKPPQAKALIRAILEAGGVRWGDHALKELAKDDLEVSDAINVLRGGVVREPEWDTPSRHHASVWWWRSGLKRFCAW